MTCSPMEHMRAVRAGTEWPRHLPKQVVVKWLINDHVSPPEHWPPLVIGTFDRACSAQEAQQRSWLIHGYLTRMPPDS